MLSSKGRRVAYEQNNTTAHFPIPQPNGALRCSSCSGIYSPAAFEAHKDGKAAQDAFAGVYIMPGDPWLADAKSGFKDSLNDAFQAEQRAEQVAEYYLEQRRKRLPHVAEFVGASMFDD